MNRSRRNPFLPALAIAAGILFPTPWGTPDAQAFCGFYVGRAGAELFNEASQVAIARNGTRTVITMANDYEGELSEFALVVPVPSVLTEGQIHVGEPAIVEHLDAFTAPRLVEYHDPNPCRVVTLERLAPASEMAMMDGAAKVESDEALGVTVEAQYTIGEYDIVILSAKESTGLETWLRGNDYAIPAGASEALQPYINQDMRFFVARVNLGEQKKTGLQSLRPLQFAYEDERFMLPIRLGMVNARGPQDLVIYVLTKEGRVETTNYRTVELPSGMDIPVFVKNDFDRFYTDMFATQVAREKGRGVFTEYFWDMGWCDPCAADPLSRDELRKLGVFWLEDDRDVPSLGGSRFRPPPGPTGAVPVKVTRLHVRYEKSTFPEDLVFQETKDRQNFQARYVLRHKWKGSPKECDAAGNYFEKLPERLEKEAQTLANLTGWDIDGIRDRMDFDVPKPNPTPVADPPAVPWWRRLWE